MYRILTVQCRYDKQPYHAEGVFLPAVQKIPSNYPGMAFGYRKTVTAVKKKPDR
jgi:hypothetical protein